MTPLNVLVLSRNYPNNVMPLLGLWVERPTQYIAKLCRVRVIAPVPYCPPLPGLPQYTRFRRIPAHDKVSGVPVLHPRFVTGPGYSLHSLEASTYYWGIRHRVGQLRSEFPFDLIHAHFSYPDGRVAARLGRRYGVPVIITEHAPWRPWMEAYPLVRRQATWAARESTFLIAVSRAVRESILHFTGSLQQMRVIPNGVDGSIFAAPQNGDRPRSNQILFVGIMRLVKGVDILLKAMRLLVDRGRDVKLAIVGESFYQSYRRDQKLFRQMVDDLRLESRVRFLGPKSSAEVAQQMRDSALLVLPSRAESFGVVLAEALACGTPVVATCCGGPEDIVNEKVGVLVPVEDAEALARAIDDVLQRRADYDPAELRAYALDRFGLESVARRVAALYYEAVDHFRKAGGREPRDK